jgi:hypothetical protein
LSAAQHPYTRAPGGGSPIAPTSSPGLAAGALAAEEMPVTAHRVPRRSFAARSRARVAHVSLAVAVGAASGIAAVIALVAARVALVAGGHHLAAEGYIALVTPLVCALGGGLLAIALLHRCKVADRDVLIGGAIAAAAPAFALGHLARLFDPATALAAGDAAGRLSLAFWLHGCEWLERARAADVVREAPGLRPVADLVGIEACAALAMCELLLVAGLLLAAVDRALATPLCPSCRRWCRRQGESVRRSAAAPPALVMARAGARDWHFFRELGPPRGRASLRLDLAACPTCDRMSALRIALDRPLRPAITLVRDLRLGPDDLRTVRELAAAARRRRALGEPSGSVPVFLPRG